MALAVFAHATLDGLRNMRPSSETPVALQRATAALDTLVAINSGPHASTNEERLLREISALSDIENSVATVICYVPAQNAAVLISKIPKTPHTDEPTKLTFEAFELSPRNAAVYKDAGRLQRTFPGPAS